MQVNGITLDDSDMHQAESSEKATWRDYLSITKVGITVANLMSTFAGLWVGSHGLRHGHPEILAVIFTLLGTALIVAGGAALNNFVDRDIDQRMTRTVARAVAKGKIPASHALGLGLTLGAVGIIILVVGVNLSAALCGLIGIIMYSYLYTVWLKRTTTLSTVLGGVAGAMPPLIGWAAGSGGSLDVGAWVLFFTFFLWQPPHFLPLAMKRSEEYRAAGIPMLPVVRGFQHTKWQILLYTAAMVPVSLLLYLVNYENAFYLFAAGILGLIFLGRAIQGINVKEDLPWANKLFTYSLFYLTAMCVILVIGAQ